VGGYGDSALNLICRVLAAVSVRALRPGANLYRFPCAIEKVHC